MIALLVFLVAIGVYAVSTFYFTKSNTMSTLAGTYVEQTSTGQGQRMQLNTDGTLLVTPPGDSPHISGTWKILDNKTLETSYQGIGATIVEQFNVTDKGLISIQTGNLWFKQ